MSDYRDSNPNDPLRSGTRYDPDARSANAAWGWIAGAVFLVVILAVAFGVGRGPNDASNKVANNNMAPPAMTQTAPAPTPAHPLPPSGPMGSPSPGQ